jgi:hypothetical protein
MKVICLSILLLVTSAMAYIDGVKPGDHHRRTRRGVSGNNRALRYDGTEKGGKGMGMGGMGMKDKKGVKGCQSLKIKTFVSEVEIVDNAIGETIFFPAYDYYTDEVIGTYTNSNTNVFDGGEIIDCVVSGSYNLGLDESLEFPFEDQIMTAGSCSTTLDAITGGTGQYACASGYEEILDSGDNDIFATELTICNTCT